MFEQISSLQNPRIKKALRLHSARGRQQQKRMIVFGEREVMRLINADFKLDEIFAHESAAIDQSLLQAQSASGTKLLQLPDEVFAKLAYGDRCEGLIATANRPETNLVNIKIADSSLVLVVQSIEKPGNLGAILRSADAAGVTAVIHADPTTDFYHPNAIRSSTGGVFKMQLATASSIETQDWLKQYDFNVFAALLNGASDFYESELIGNVAIVLGNEANGLDEQWFKPEFKAVKLPMRGTCDSLNVSVTASIMIYEAMRQRNS